MKIKRQSLTITLTIIIYCNLLFSQQVDHKNLNLDTDFMKGKIPTSENIVIAIWNELEDKITKGKLFSVKLYETENNYFEYKGE